MLREQWISPMCRSYFTKSYTPYSLIWALVFLYTALIAAFVQLIALPYIVPEWHAGHGLLSGGDWIWFHELAVKMSENILMNGWGEWMLRPQGQAPAGIAAAIYTLTVPEPWTVIPLNAALHAAAAVVLIVIIQRFTSRWQYALIASLPFILYPSAMTWYTQLHKDGFFILGSLVFLLGWITIVERINNFHNPREIIKAYLLIMTGATLVWVVRPYGVQMMQGVALLIVVGISVYALVFKKYLQSFGAKSLLIPVLLCFIIVSLTPLTQQGVDIREVPETKIMHWKAMLPSRLDSAFYTLAVLRNGFIDAYPDAGSNIDTDIRFHSALDVIAYVPRALEIALLAPFPNMWLGSGSAVNSSFIRKVSGFEMLGIYFGLLLTILSFKKWRENPAWWIIISFCVGMMVIYALVGVNIGSLYRTRYGFIMTIVALGFSYLFSKTGKKKEEYATISEGNGAAYSSKG
ncbi:MAG: hypothetical protein GX160_00220 [Clostridiales bacterium]|nr:hypothetical protein [Clostridiales bacterium]